MLFTAPKGTRDILPSESRAWQELENKFSAICQRFGYREIRIPSFEQTELFQRGVGDGTDVVQKEMYSFEDKGGRSITLRPEGTAGVARSYIERGLASEPSPLKLYYLINAFRYEKMQKGRYREFHQLGCELFGSEAPEADAELISLLWTFFRELGLKEINLRLNSIGCPRCRPAYLEALRAWMRPKYEALCPDCRRRGENNPMRVLDCKEESCRRLTQDAPAQLEALCPDCAAHWRELLLLLDAFAIPYTIDRRVVRGLDYYSRSVFEFVSEHVGSQGSICGGGRYDGLLEQLGAEPTPGTGFALGTERLLMELASQGVSLPDYAPPLLFVAAFPACRPSAAELCFRLRTGGVAAENDLCGRSVKAQLKHANRLKARYLLLLGEEELRGGCGKIKRMRDGVETELAFSDMADWLKGQEGV